MGISSSLGSSALSPAGLGFRNVIINGGFDVWQRGTSVTPASGYGYGADRWRTYSYGASTSTISQQTFTAGTAPVAGQEGKYFLRVNSTSTQTYLAQPIEGVRSLAGRNVAVSFWAKASSGTPTLTAYLNQYFGTGGSPSADVLTTVGSVTLTTTWTQYRMTIVCPSISGKTIGTGGNDYLEFYFLSVVNNAIDFYGIQVEGNAVPTPFEQRPIGVELALCQRYYEKSFALGTAPANTIYSVSTSGTVTYSDLWVLAMAWLPFSVEKRVVPNMTFFGASAGLWQVANSDNSWSTFAGGVGLFQGNVGIKTKGFGLGVHNNGAQSYGLGLSRMVRGDWVAESEL